MQMNFSDFLQEDLQEAAKKVSLNFSNMADLTKALGKAGIQSGIDDMTGKTKILIYSGYSSVATISSNGVLRLKSPSYSYIKDKAQPVIDEFINNL